MTQIHANNTTLYIWVLLPLKYIISENKLDCKYLTPVQMSKCTRMRLSDRDFLSLLFAKNLCHLPFDWYSKVAFVAWVWAYQMTILLHRKQRLGSIYMLNHSSPKSFKLIFIFVAFDCWSLHRQLFSAKLFKNLYKVHKIFASKMRFFKMRPACEKA